MTKHKNRKKIKAASPKRKLDKHPPSIEDNDQKCVKFSLEYVQETTRCNFSDLDAEGKRAFADAIFKRRNITWADIKTHHRHNLGFEMLDKTAIKPSQERLPTEMRELKKYMVFRYHKTLAMVGHRERDVFYVFWFDHNHHNRSVYGHGA